MSTAPRGGGGGIRVWSIIVAAGREKNAAAAESYYGYSNTIKRIRKRIKSVFFNTPAAASN